VRAAQGILITDPRDAAHITHAFTSPIAAAKIQASDAARKPAPLVEAACWRHSRRKFFELAITRKAPIAIEAVLPASYYAAFHAVFRISQMNG
jgi:hypothetical protein